MKRIYTLLALFLFLCLIAAPNVLAADPEPGTPEYGERLRNEIIKRMEEREAREQEQERKRLEEEREDARKRRQSEEFGEKWEREKRQIKVIEEEQEKQRQKQEQDEKGRKERAEETRQQMEDMAPLQKTPEYFMGQCPDLLSVPDLIADNIDEFSRKIHSLIDGIHEERRRIEDMQKADEGNTPQINMQNMLAIMQNAMAIPQVQNDIAKIYERWAEIARVNQKEKDEVKEKIYELETRWRKEMEAVPKTGSDIHGKPFYTDADLEVMQRLRYQGETECYTLWRAHIANARERIKSRFADVPRYDECQTLLSSLGGTPTASAGFDIAAEYLEVTLGVMVSGGFNLMADLHY